MSLRVLVTNDDGYQAPGITAVVRALRDAGHRVAMVAPVDNQSGAGARISSTGRLEAHRPDGYVDTWAVDGSPADAVIFGLTHAFDDGPPDLVVSGSNAGANAGQAVHFSGTVGAAICAVAFEVPAVAVATDIGYRADAVIDQFAETADIVRRLLDRGAGTGADVVPSGVVLNVNVPAPQVGRTPRVVATRPDTLPMGELCYAGDGPEYTLQFKPGPAPASGTDTAELRRGFVTLSAVPVVGTPGPQVDDRLRSLAETLTASWMS